jgi:hypothetical protein
MKNKLLSTDLSKVFPYIISISYLILCHFRTPQIADSIIVIGLLGYLGYKNYLATKETPDIRKEINEEINKLRRELTQVKDEVNHLGVAQKGTLRGNLKF